MDSDPHFYGRGKEAQRDYGLGSMENSRVPTGAKPANNHSRLLPSNSFSICHDTQALKGNFHCVLKVSCFGCFQRGNFKIPLFLALKKRRKEEK